MLTLHITLHHQPREPLPLTPSAQTPDDTGKGVQGLLKRAQPEDSNSSTWCFEIHPNSRLSDLQVGQTAEVLEQ